MLLRITHETRYDYQPQVETAQHVAHLRPLQTPWQQVRSHVLDIQPAPAQQTEARDVYGNTRTFFSLQAPHEQLAVVARSEVATQAPPPVPLGAGASPPWDAVREHFRYRAGAACDRAAEFTFASAHAPHDEAFAAYARPSFPPGAALLDGAHDLMRRIHRDFTYAAEATEVSTPALEALAQRRGVCQDFAHIMIACLRTLGLAARYTSGYLVTAPPPGQPRLVGSDASHAWVAVYTPGAPGEAGWHAFDPTNDRSPGEDYVTLATGRDYADVSPMRGVIHGGAHHTLAVAVTVEPLPTTIPGETP